ncbi:MAG: hypothetical protein BJ554DRAFT_4600 [Olpidium bornovanus]|uniref:Uncharacterized protein n=1 Tax=Olpidium bornovanus TaxID=278681 RepID=A0A8H8A084_9FUNG|nr:MAG: hypothetical protein BJ554DRAFT_4600 [Olpidium bornovanus]
MTSKMHTPLEHGWTRSKNEGSSGTFQRDPITILVAPLEDISIDTGREVKPLVKLRSYRLYGQFIHCTNSRIVTTVSQTWQHLFEVCSPRLRSRVDANNEMFQLELELHCVLVRRVVVAALAVAQPLRASAGGTSPGYPRVWLRVATRFFPPAARQRATRGRVRAVARPPRPLDGEKWNESGRVDVLFSRAKERVDEEEYSSDFLGCSSTRAGTSATDLRSSTCSTTRTPTSRHDTRSPGPAPAAGVTTGLGAAGEPGRNWKRLWQDVDDGQAFQTPVKKERRAAGPSTGRGEEFTTRFAQSAAPARSSLVGAPPSIYEDTPESSSTTRRGSVHTPAERQMQHGVFLRSQKIPLPEDSAAQGRAMASDNFYLLPDLFQIYPCAPARLEVTTARTAVAFETLYHDLQQLVETQRLAERLKTEIQTWREKTADLGAAGATSGADAVRIFARIFRSYLGLSKKLGAVSSSFSTQFPRVGWFRRFSDRLSAAGGAASAARVRRSVRSPTGRLPSDKAQESRAKDKPLAPPIRMLSLLICGDIRPCCIPRGSTRDIYFFWDPEVAGESCHACVFRSKKRKQTIAFN